LLHHNAQFAHAQLASKSLFLQAELLQVLVLEMLKALEVPLMELVLEMHNQLEAQPQVLELVTHNLQAELLLEQE